MKYVVHLIDGRGRQGGIDRLGRDSRFGPVWQAMRIIDNGRVSQMDTLELIVLVTTALTGLVVGYDG